MKYLFENEYKEWLINSKALTRESAASYVSYMSSLCNTIKISDEHINVLISRYHDNGEHSMIDSILANTMESLYLEDICDITQRPKNTINNWRSALLQYREFFYEFSDITPVEQLETSSVIEPQITLVSENLPKEEETKKVRFRTYRFSSREIMSNFRFRLITQDRFFGEVFFPISYVKRLLCQNGHAEYFNSWITDQVNKVEVLCEKDSHTIGEISELKVRVSKDQSQVFVTVNNQEKAVYTPSAANTAIQPLSCRNLKGIAIDHVIPMKTILAENANNLCQLKNITLELRKIAGENATPKEYKSVGSKLLALPFSGQICLNTLKEELNLINSCTKLRLMEKIENIRKGAN